MHGGQETARKLKLGIEIVRGRFKKIGDSILNVFCCELSVATTEQITSFLASCHVN